MRRISRSIRKWYMNSSKLVLLFQAKYPLLQIPLKQSASAEQKIVLEPGFAINPKYLQPIDLFKGTELDECEHIPELVP